MGMDRTYKILNSTLIQGRDSLSCLGLIKSAVDIGPAEFL